MVDAYKCQNCGTVVERPQNCPECGENSMQPTRVPESELHEDDANGTEATDTENRTESADDPAESGQSTAESSDGLFAWLKSLF